MHEEKKDPILEGRLIRSRIYYMLPPIVSIQLSSRENSILCNINGLIEKLSKQSDANFKTLEDIQALGNYRLGIINQIEEKYSQLSECAGDISIKDMPYPLKDAYKKSWRHFIDWIMSEIIKYNILPHAEKIYQDILDETELLYQKMMGEATDIYESELEGVIKSKD
ncbi:hypothetical protein [Azospirillum doebereinerae]